jgi:hypothetical protein
MEKTLNKKNSKNTVINKIDLLIGFFNIKQIKNIFRKLKNYSIR